MARHGIEKHPNPCTFRVPTEADIRYVAEHMRIADRVEIKRMSGTDPLTELKLSIAASKRCYAAALGDGAVCCIFGASCVNLVDGTAILWMLSTDDVNRRPYEFALGSLHGVDRICRELPEVAEFGNFVDTDYVKAIKWVEWFGGGFTRERRTGRCGGVFRFFCFENPYNKED